MESGKALLLLLLFAFYSLVCCQDLELVGANGLRLTLVGRGAAVVIRANATSTEHIRLTFGSVQELGANGEVVASRSIAALTSSMPVVSTGTRVSGSSTYTWAQLYFPLGMFTSISTSATSCASAPAVERRRLQEVQGANSATPSSILEASNTTTGAPSPPTAVVAPAMFAVTNSDFAGTGDGSGPAVSSAYIKLTFYFGNTYNVSFPYGLGRTMVMPGGAVRFTLQAANWPFCSPYSSLRFQIALTSAASTPQPLLRETDDSSSSAAGGMSEGTAFTPPTLSRRLRAANDTTAASTASGDDVSSTGYAGTSTGYAGYDGTSVPTDDGTTTTTTAITAAGAATSSNSAIAGFTPGQEYLDPQLQAKADLLAAALAANSTSNVTVMRSGSVVVAEQRTPRLLTLLSSNTTSARLQLPEWAYSAANGSAASNLTVDLAANASDVVPRLLLTFPYFETLEYGAIVELGLDPVAMGQVGVDVASVAGSITKTTMQAPFNGNGAGSQRLAAGSALGLLVAVLVALVG